MSRDETEVADATHESRPDGGSERADAGWRERWSNQGPGGSRSVPTPLWVGLVLALALAVRLWGITWQLPYVLYYDELKYVRWASDTVDGRSQGPADYRNPSLTRHLFTLEFRLAQNLHPIRDQRERAAFRLEAARITTAVLGAGAVVFGALAAHVLFGGVSGLLAGLLLALNPLHVHMSHLAVNDVPASFFLAASLAAGAASLRRPSIGLPVLAGFLAGLATATKYNYGAVLLIPLIGLIIHRAKGRFLVPRVFVDTLGATLIAFAVGIFVGMPEIVTDFRAITAGLAEQAQIGQDASEDQEPTPVPLLYAETIVRGIGPLGVLASILGAGLLIRSRWGAALAILMVPAVYLAVMLKGDLFAARFALPPAIVAAVMAGGITRLIPRLNHLALALGAILLLAPLVRDVVQHNRLATAVDTRLLAAEWLRTEGQDARVAVQAYSMPPDWAGRPLPNNARVSRFLSLLTVDAERRLECDGTNYVTLATFNYERQLRGLPDPRAETGYGRLIQRAEHVTRFTPFPSGSSAPAHPDDTAIPFWYMHAYERPGPLIDVYRIPDAVRAECPGNNQQPQQGNP
jgi:Dolichyl-phosphate-mannose-protein mannosyltransferase